jgi:acyl carrier protein
MGKDCVSDAPLREQGMDSLDLLEFATALEEANAVEFTDEECERHLHVGQTPQQIIDWLIERNDKGA